MGERSGLEPRPNLYLAEDGEWPYGDLVDDAPLEAHLAMGVSRRFKNAIGSRAWSIRRASKEIGISSHAVYDLLKGNSWGTLPTIARIEIALKREMWDCKYVEKLKWQCPDSSDRPYGDPAEWLYEDDDDS